MSLPAAFPPVILGLRLVRAVGRGGEGEVWQARDPRGRLRALKLVRPEALAEPTDLRVRAGYLRRIRHPALVRVHRSGLLAGAGLDGWGYLEMDYVDGRSLHDLGAGTDLLEALEPLAEALDLLHAGMWSDGVPLVHRDVKPANIVRAHDGRLVLVDPSTLRGVDATHLTRVGTPVFSAPEVLTGRIGPAADVYSFAVTVLALVSGARGSQLARLVDAAERLALPAAVRLALSTSPAERPGSCWPVLAAAAGIPADLADRDTDGAWEAGWEVGRDADGGAGVELGSSVGWDPDGGAGVGSDGGWDADREPAPDVGPLWELDPAGASAEHGPTDARPRVRAAWPWVGVLLVIVGVPALGWMSGVLAGERLQEALLVAAAVHLLAHLAAGRRLGLAVLAPPLSWAFLLADRAVPGRRRRGWARALLSGALLLMVAPTLALALDLLPDRQVAAGMTVAGLALVVAAVRALDRGRVAGALLRLALLPLWALGAVVLLAGAVALLPLAPLAGRTGDLARLARDTVGGAVESFRPPADPPAPAIG